MLVATLSHFIAKRCKLISQIYFPPELMHKFIDFFYCIEPPQELEEFEL
jgi:hypothetical protein